MCGGGGHASVEGEEGRRHAPISVTLAPAPTPVLTISPTSSVFASQIATQHREGEATSAFADTAFPSDVLGEILIRAGAWSYAVEEEEQDGAALDNAHHIAYEGGAAAPPAEQGPAAAAAAGVARRRMCAWIVCSAWRDCLRGPPPDHLARLLLEVHGLHGALIRAEKCTSITVDRCALIRAVLKLPGIMANCQDGETLLLWASARGCESVMRLLLGWREHAPLADCQDGMALVSAAEGGHEAVVRLLLGWREHAPRADCRDGIAFVLAAAGGHEAVVRLLLGWGEHAPRADCLDGLALVSAAEGGHKAVVQLLLGWREHAPRADCRDGDALVLAAARGNEEIVRLLLGWGEHAPRADCQDGRPLSAATAGGHEQVVRYLQDAINNMLPTVPVL